MASKKTSSKRVTSKKKQTKKNSKNLQTVERTTLAGEITVWAALAVSIILLIGNFGLGGIVGRSLSYFFFGLFGLPAYLAPFFLFLFIGFIVANSFNSRVLKKGAAAFGVLFFLCGLIQIFTVPFVKTAKLSSYFAYSGSEKKAGGLFGGILMKLFHPLFGKIGTVIVLLILFMICVVLLTEKAILSYVHKKSSKAYDSAREGIKTRHAKHREIAAMRREEQRELAAARREAKQEEESKRHAERMARIEREKELRKTMSIPGDFSATTLSKKETRPLEELQATQNNKETAEDRLDKMLASGKQNDKNQTTTEIKMPTPRHAVSVPKQESVASDTDDMEEIIPAPVTEEPSKKVTKAESQEAFLHVSEEIEQNELEPVKEYKFPPLSLLKKGSRSKKGMSDEALKATALKLEETLNSFGVHATVTDISCGPTVTRYELQPEVGVKVSKILSLTDDIKLNLAVSDIRIEAPIPGKAAIGIEVPNTENVSIMLRDLLETNDFLEHPSKIAFAVGMDVVGNIMVADIYKMPHLLIGGATGSGKSVCINTLIMSILYKAKPDEVKFIMIDPKMIELNLYNGIPHLFIPVVTDPKKAAGALQWAVAEMTKRYKLFSELAVRDLKGYNKKVETLPPPEEGEEPKRKMPQIVIVVDEFADLMMVASGEVEEAVCRLAQLARAAGIHLILATQRPSVDVITGLIKANMPSRIALTVSSGVDSRTIIDMVGAEKLLGKGDMLYYPQNYPKPVRVQGAFVSEKEVEDVISYIIDQNGDAAYDESIAEEVQSNASGCGKGAGGGGSVSDPDARDEYFEAAARFIVDKDKASIGLLQRNFKIGFNRAARIMDALADAGIVGAEEGTKPRRILMSEEQLEAYFEEYL